MLSREQRLIVQVAVLGILILTAYLAGLIPLKRQGASLALQLQSARERLRMLETATANQAALQEQYRQVEQTVASLRGVLPAEGELPATIERLSDLANQAQVKIQNIAPQRTLVTPGDLQNGSGKAPAGPVVYYKEVLIQIDALAGYHQLGTFLSLVESGEKPMQVSSLHISENQKDFKRQRVKLLIRAFFAVSGKA